ncbi:MAG: DUF1453 family protein [Caulobacterales bacterium]|nr:DUF1453 family protein [Caulobacterales bacterium]
MKGLPPGAPAWTYLIPVVVLGLVILRNSRARTLRVERLWISPLIVVAICGMALYASPVPGPVGLAVDALALGLGVALGWWRGRASTFTVDPQTHVVTSKVSPLGMLLILGIVALRYGLRSAMAGGASALHVSAAEFADSFLLLAMGVVCAQRIEWYIRARKMINAARAAKAA